MSLTLAIPIIVLTIIYGRVQAQCQTLYHTFGSPTPSSNDEFGYSVGIEGNNLLVGSHRDNTSATDAGIAFLFDATTGALLRSINNPTPDPGDFFGRSVAIFGSSILIGASHDDTVTTDSGSAYLFDATTGGLLHTFFDPTPNTDEYFGVSVALFGTRAVVGSLYDDTGTTDAGAAYLFDVVTGTLIHTFSNPTPVADDYFARTVALSGTTAVIGAHGDDTAASLAGGAYLFDTVTGNLLHTLNNPTPIAGDTFGFPVAISGNYVLVAATRDDTGATDAGSAYLFDAVTGELLQTLNNPTPALTDLFGYSALSISGSKIIVGAYQDDTGATNAGSAYLFDGNTGALLKSFNNPAPSNNDQFGWSVAISDVDDIAIGSILEDTIASNSGSVYLFRCPNAAAAWGFYE